MKVIVCIDKAGGMSFNHRRISRDRVIINDIISCYQPLIMNHYSYSLFKDKACEVQIVENLPVESDAYQFIENIDINHYSFDEMIVYCFNRLYPSDLKLNLDGYKMIETGELNGYSHDLITKLTMRKKV